jgi:hypothetical protein
MTTAIRQPVLQARGLVKRYGRVTALASGDLELYPAESLAVVGDNGAGKSTLIKALAGALTPDSGDILLDGEPVHFRTPMDARRAGIETVYQTLAVAPALDIADNLFLGREERRPGILGSVFRLLDRRHMRSEAQRHMGELGITTLQNIRQAARGPGEQPGAAAHPRRPRPRAGGDPHQPQHAARLRGGRPHPHPAPRPPRHRHHAAVAHHGRGGRDHDRGRRTPAAGRLTGR